MILNHEIPILTLTKNLGIYGDLRIEGGIS